MGHEMVSQERARRESGQADQQQLPALFAGSVGGVFGGLLRDLAVNLHEEEEKGQREE